MSGALTVAIAATLPALVPTTSSAGLDDLTPGPTSHQAPAHRLVIKLASPAATARVTIAASEAARVSSQKPKPLGGGWYLLTGVDDVGAARVSLALSLIHI